MKKIKKFLKDNQWSILAVIGALTWLALLVEIFIGAMEVVGFYVAMANL